MMSSCLCLRIERSQLLLLKFQSLNGRQVLQSLKEVGKWDWAMMASPESSTSKHLKLCIKLGIYLCSTFGIARTIQRDWLAAYSHSLAAIYLRWCMLVNVSIQGMRSYIQIAPIESPSMYDCSILYCVDSSYFKNGQTGGWGSYYVIKSQYHLFWWSEYWFLKGAFRRGSDCEIDPNPEFLCPLLLWSVVKADPTCKIPPETQHIEDACWYFPIGYTYAKGLHSSSSHCYSWFSSR